MALSSTGEYIWNNHTEFSLLVLGLLFWKEAIILYGKEGSGTHVFKFLVKALITVKGNPRIVLRTYFQTDHVF